MDWTTGRQGYIRDGLGHWETGITSGMDWDTGRQGGTRDGMCMFFLLLIQKVSSLESDSEPKSVRSSFNLHAISRLVPLSESSLTHFKSAVTCTNLFLCCACPLPLLRLPCVQCAAGLRLPLRNIGAVLPEDDPEIVQRVCGVLDVNSFEVRAPGLPSHAEHLRLRAVYLQAALMAHHCVANTHLAVDDNFLITIHASVPISQGQPIFFNYTNPLQGTSERREHLHEGKYFDCTCSRCRDPTELGTYMSSLKCVKCRGKGLVSPVEALRENSPWECNQCGHYYSALVVHSATARGKDLLEDIDKTSSDRLVSSFLLAASSDRLVGSFLLATSSDRLMSSFLLAASSDILEGSFLFAASSDRLVGSFLLAASSDILEGSFLLATSSDILEGSFLFAASSDILVGSFLLAALSDRLVGSFLLAASSDRL
uniref:SET domain-containing protein n=1 Tax=Timema genevievae TaxID=629358 RepID=A0A7R9K5P9_TIMGE|nr:unnamed protein product [Timema genevievae]